MYSLSIGTYCIKSKTLKKSKLVLINLPSKKSIYCLKESLCICGFVANEITTIFNYGKFGSYLKSKYRTVVRGVAKNPVDHPNGGRTKSKSPEYSP
ncbi:MAG: hypothetical protein KDH96_08705 [Candidatus Riesia sp.]|nr:hypothetical protein [Candidatus Riesia sp.]